MKTVQQQAKAIFDKAIELPSDQQSELVSRECEKNPDVGEAVRGLLNAYLQAGSFLDKPIL